MVIELPHYSFTEYLRDFFFGTLEKICAGNCPVCGGRVCHLELRLRSVQGLPIYRARCCEGCKSSLTFLPQFVCPGKWYGYQTIEKALLFISQGDSPNTALEAWEENREILLEAAEENFATGRPDLPPSTSTVKRWWNELGQPRPNQVWQERCLEEGSRLDRQRWPGIVASCGPDGLVGEKSIPGISELFSETPSTDQTVDAIPMLRLLVFLGEALLGSHGMAGVSCFGTGLWFLEASFQKRFLARQNLVGRIIPFPRPNLNVTAGGVFSYPPEPSQPP